MSQEPWRSRHDEADEAGRDLYLDPETGLMVMTRGALLRRGTCCDSGCRHCPYRDHSDDT